MPVVKRSIVPVQIARAPIPTTVKDDLEASAVNGIAGLIKQVRSIVQSSFQVLFNLLKKGE